VTSDRLETDDQMLVLPEWQVADVVCEEA